MRLNAPPCLPIGYGDLAHKFLLSRVLAIAKRMCGVLLAALIAAIAVNESERGKQVWTPSGE